MKLHHVAVLVVVLVAKCIAGNRDGDENDDATGHSDPHILDTRQVERPVQMRQEMGSSSTGNVAETSEKPDDSVEKFSVNTESKVPTTPEQDCPSQEEERSKETHLASSSLAKVTSRNSDNREDCIKLNVGGQIFTTTRMILCTREPSSMLARMFCSDSTVSFKPGYRDKNGAYIIDRSPKYFEPILNYLRHGELIIDNNVNVQGVLKEAEFYGIGSLIPLLEEPPLTRQDVIKAIITTTSTKDLRFQGCNLAGADLSGLDLRKINLKYANLRGANLQGADLSYSILEHADLSEANLEGIRLVGANLQECNLSGADLSGHFLRHMNFRHANLRGAKFQKTDLSFSDMRHVNLYESNLEGARLVGTVLMNANLENSNLKSISEVELHNAFSFPTDTIFMGANMKNVILDGSQLGRASFRGAILKGSRIRNCNLRGAILVEANLEDCDFSGSHLDGADLRNAKVNGARMEFQFM